MNILKYSEITSKRWRTLDVFLLCHIFCLFSSNIPSTAAEFSLSSRKLTTKTILDKYKCQPYDNFPGNTTPNETSESSSASVTTATKLNCSNQSLLYRNVSEDEFVHGIFENGTLDLSTYTVNKIEPGSYCIENITGDVVRIAICSGSNEHVHHHNNNAIIANHSTAPVIIRKCCPEAQRLEMIIQNGALMYTCVAMPNGSKWEPAIFRSTSDDYAMHIDLDDLPNHIIRPGFPHCSGGLTKSFNNSKDIWFMLLENGSVEIGLKFWFKPVWLPVQDNEFCVDEVADHDPTLPNSPRNDSHKNYHKNQILLYCQIAHFDDYLFHRRFFGIQCIVAAVIVFILLIIYVAIWDKQNLAGWTQFNIFVALFFVVLMEGLRTLLDANALKVESTTTCVIIAAVAQFFFFALNTTWSVMCFDLFYMFWKLETTSKTIARYRNRLICYLLCSWGLPFVVVCIAFYFSHHIATEEMGEMKGVYAFAHRRCSSPIRKLGFQTQGIMFLLNLIFFLCTTLLIWKHRRGLNAARKRSRNERHTWRSVCLFIKLVVVMGVSSLTIPIDYFFVSSAPLSSLAICFRLIHFIPFLAVLFIFGFNEKNMVLISQKYPRIGKYFGFVACTSGATASDTINHSRSYNNRTSDHTSSPT